MDETKIEPHDGELESHADKTESENSVHAALGRLTNQRLHSTAKDVRKHELVAVEYPAYANGSAKEDKISG